jgi:radical SAM superfamily enzyme YgiQ (UPF0313 family)
MVYKKGPRFRVRPVEEVAADIQHARKVYGDQVETIFFPAGNTIAMPTEALAVICAYAHCSFPRLRRVTVYGSSQYICRKGPGDLHRLRKSGLSRIHVGIESGDDVVLQRIRKGSDSVQHIQAGQWVKEAGMELNAYVILGIGGQDRTREHAQATARVLSAINPHTVRLRTFLPKINTLLLHQIRRGRFHMLSAHEVLQETRRLLRNLDVTSQIRSDHYTNYINLSGRLPADKQVMLRTVNRALQRNETSFRPIYVGRH